MLLPHCAELRCDIALVYHLPYPLCSPFPRLMSRLTRQGGLLLFCVSSACFLNVKLSVHWSCEY
jgi:hypothetical protein